MRHVTTTIARAEYHLLLDSTGEARFATFGPLPLEYLDKAQPWPGHPAERLLERYAEGDLGALDEIAVHQGGTDFQLAVWRALRIVPAGTTVNYQELASLAGHPRAIRAVASGCARNPVPLIVPCHRAIHTDGTLGGYAFGPEVKEALLVHEGAALA